MKLNKTLGFNFLEAISNGMKENTNYPSASIQEPGGYFCITVIAGKKENEEFESLIKIFPELCAKYGIRLLPSHNEYTRKRVPQGATDLIKYEFFISPNDLDRILMNESDYYRGYRSQGSVLRLAYPLHEAFKRDTICLFPVLEMDSNQIMLRIAGCNASETITTQLAYYFTKYLSFEVGSAELYGHHIAPIVEEKIGLYASDFLEVALETIGIKTQLNHQSEEGFTVFSLEGEAREFLVEIDSEARTIYRLLSAVTPDELPNLKSIEVPITTYLQALGSKLSTKSKSIREELIEIGNEFKSLQEEVNTLLKEGELTDDIKEKTSNLHMITLSHGRNYEQITKYCNGMSTILEILDRINSEKITKQTTENQTKVFAALPLAPTFYQAPEEKELKDESSPEISPRNN
ncbi:hypothetical protein [Legionella saoudiensis]|uniref:hypothetical protein n=1 Tax=Legionella saoudiensis TaxID=1750561 RepID=UPI000731DAAC|nr:hypothetical protein [Legionella saoudiensis]